MYRERPANELSGRAKVASRVERRGKLALADAGGPQCGSGIRVGEQRLSEPGVMLGRAGGRSSHQVKRREPAERRRQFCRHVLSHQQASGRVEIGTHPVGVHAQPGE